MLFFWTKAVLDALTDYNKVVVKEFYEEKEPQTFFPTKSSEFGNFEA